MRLRETLAVTRTVVEKGRFLMPRILGVDSSLTATGLARIDIEIGKPNGPDYVWDIAAATVGAPKPDPRDKSKRAMARRVLALTEQIESAIFDPDVDAPDAPLPGLIAIESLAYGAKGSSAWVLPWVFGKVFELAVKYDIPTLEVTPGQRAKYISGSGNADKDTVMLAAAKRWPEAEIANNNEADAVGVGAIGCDWLGYPIVQRSKYHEDVMTAIRKANG